MPSLADFVAADQAEIDAWRRRRLEKDARQYRIEKQERVHLEAIAVIAADVVARTVLIGRKTLLASDPGRFYRSVGKLRPHVEALRESGLLKLLSARHAVSSENQVTRSPRRARHGSGRNAARR